MDFQSGFRGLEERGPGRRWFLPALAFSFLLHALLLLPEPRQSHGREGRLPIAATLRPMAVPAQPALPEPAAFPIGKKAKPRSRESEGESAPGRAAGKMPAVAASQSAQRSDPRADPGPATAAAANQTDGSIASVSAGPDADGIRAYRIALAREARHQRRYPLLARERGWTGTADIELDVSEQGQVRSLRLIRSSGHDSLDREAMAMMTRAARVVVLPARLRGLAFTVHLSVEFRLPPALPE